MSIDKSLRGGSRLARTRNVLTRDERIVKMKETEKWKDETSPFGLPKLRVIKPTVGKKKKKTAEEDKEKDKKDKKGKK
ncbi:MAG: small basic protein [Planctomycetota bacterium]|nr:MAG: small basic protein [Planctomycetota bacterium]